MNIIRAGFSPRASPNRHWIRQGEFQEKRLLHPSRNPISAHPAVTDFTDSA